MGHMKQAQETSDAALRMKAFIDSHIREPITARQLSDAAGYSQYHAARIFKQHTGRMPFEYIREKRLINAALSLRSSKTFNESEFEQAIVTLWERVEKFNPVVYGYEYADEFAPRMQLAPYGWRGYIEMRPVREIAQ